MSNGKGSAFLKGGLGCLLAFIVVGVIFVCLGGSMHINLGGAILLFVIGGILGLIALAVYNKGRRDAFGVPPTMRDQPTLPPEPERAGESGKAETQCPNCGAMLNAATGEGVRSLAENPGVVVCASCGQRI